MSVAMRPQQTLSSLGVIMSGFRLPIRFLSVFVSLLAIAAALSNAIGTYSGANAAPSDPAVLPEGSISGYVSGPQGSLAGATVTARLPFGGYESNPVTTGSDGLYSITGLPPADYQVIAKASGYVSQYYDGTYVSTEASLVTVAASGDVAGIDFSLDPGGYVTGRVQEFGSLNAVEGAEIRAELTSGEFESDPFFSSADGSYTIDGLPSGSFRVLASANGYVREYSDGAYFADEATPVEVTAPGTLSNVDFTLDLGGSISGIVAQADGTLLSAVEVGASMVDGSYESAEFLTSADGSYTVAGLPSGDYLVSARSKGYVTEYYEGAYIGDQSTSIAVTQFEDTPNIDFTLDPSHSINGYVHETDGVSPVFGARVWARFINTSAFDGQMSFTAPDGSYSIDGLPLGTYRVTTEAIGFARQYYRGIQTYFRATPVSVSALDDTFGVDFALDPGGTISGTVTRSDGAGMLNGARVVAEVPNSFDRYDAVVTADGSYSITGLPSGSYRVSAHAGGHVIQYYGDTYVSSEAASVDVVAPQETAGINLALDAGGSISGIVQGTAYLPVPGATLRASMVDGSYWSEDVHSSRDGSYTINGLPTGTYRVFSEAHGYVREYYDGSSSSYSATPVNVVAQVDTPGVNISLDQGGSISGSVHSAEDGAPIYDAIIWVSGGGTWTAYSAGENGSFRISGLADGNYRLHADAPEYALEYYLDTYAYSQATDVPVVVSQDTQGIDFLLGVGGSISGRVYEADGTTPLVGANVRAVRVDRTYFIISALSTHDGSYQIDRLPSGDYDVYAIAADHVTEYYDGTYVEGKASPVTVVAPEITNGIDLDLDLGGSISGHVYQGDGITPIAGASLQAETVDGVSVAGRSGADGGYVINGVPTGAYRVWCWASGYAPEYYDGVYAPEVASEVSVAAPDNTQLIDFQLDPGVSPGVLTWGAYAIDPTSFRLSGYLSNLGTASLVDVSFAWGTDSFSLPNVTTSQPTDQLGSFHADLAGLAPNTTYYYRARAIGDGFGWGSVKAFTTGVPELTVVSVGPVPNALNVSASSNIDVRFNTSVDGSSVTGDTFNVDGSLSGKVAGSYAGGGTETITFDPAADFKPGETLTVTLTDGILSLDSRALSSTYTWQFVVKTPSGYADFSDSGQLLGDSGSEGGAIGDLDGDGDLDAVLANYGGANSVWLNNGDGSGSAQIPGSSTGNTLDVRLADLDNDGDMDAFLVKDGRPNRVWLNDGAGNFGRSGEALGNSNSTAAALGDFDRDGDIDAFVGNWDQPDIVWLNDGTGHFYDSGQLLGASTSLDAAMADLDGDGDLDILVVNGVQPASIWLNDGSGNFTIGGQLLNNLDSRGVALGDLDGDGDIDAFVVSHGGNAAWLNDGTADFFDSGQALGSSDSEAVALGDLDGDGDLDAFVANIGDEPNEVWLNDGSAVFQDSGLRLGSSFSVGIALGDLDADGDLDALVINSGAEPSSIWLNTAPPAPTPTLPPSGGGGGFGGGGFGGGGPVGPGTINLTIYTNSEGKFNLPAVAESEDGLVSLSIDKGVVAHAKDGGPLKSLQIVPVDGINLPSYMLLVGALYEITPDGATFMPDITLAISYDPEWLLPDVDPDSLTIATLNTGVPEWELIDSVHEKSAHVVSALVNHLSYYAIVGTTKEVPPALPPTPPPTPARFSLTGIAAIPPTAEPGQIITVSVTVANLGGTSGEYDLTLKIDGEIETDRRVEITAGQTIEVEFPVKRATPGVYQVKVNDATVSFVVETSAPGENPTTIPPQPTPAPEESSGGGGANLALILSLISGVLIIGGGFFVVARLRRRVET
jgi:hypothetical protein